MNLLIVVETNFLIKNWKSFLSIWLVTKLSFWIYYFSYFSYVFRYFSSFFIVTLSMFWCLVTVPFTFAVYKIHMICIKTWIIINDVESKRNNTICSYTVCHKWSTTDSNIINLANELPHKLPKKLGSD